MNRFFLAVAAVCAAVSAYSADAPYVDRQVLVKFKSGTVTALPPGATVIKSWPQIKAQLVRLKLGMSVTQGIAFFRQRPDVVYAEPNLIRHWFKNVNDPLANQQYHLTRIKAREAWDFGTGNSNIVVAVLDSGFELSHVDMAGKFTPGFDFMDNDTDPTWVTEPHGVETSGCVAAATDNGVGIASIGFNCKVMPLRVGDFFIPESNSVSGMIWAADKGAKVINMSYGGPGSTQAARDATEYAWGKGVVLVASAGNDGGTEVNYPAGYPRVIPVAATDQNDQRAGFSTHGDWVTVAAPGVAVVTTMPSNSYGPADGTSFSGPITAGLAGLLRSLAPTATNVQIRDAIESTCDPVGDFVTKGRINAFKAMKKLDFALSPGIVVNCDSIATVIGNALIGDPLSVSDSDDIYYQIGTTALNNLGQAGAAEAFFTVPMDVEQISIKLEAVAGSSGGTSMVWLWDWSTGQYVHIGSTPISASGNITRTLVVRRNDVSRYVGAGGSVRLLVRGHKPNRPYPFPLPLPFTYQIDVLQLLVKSPA
jgi:hypothetical protein